MVARDLARAISGEAPCRTTDGEPSSEPRGRMRQLIVLLAFGVSTVATAADYSSWPGRDPAPVALPNQVQVAQGKDTCCKHCTKRQPCGNSCITQRLFARKPLRLHSDHRRAANSAKCSYCRTAAP